MPQITCRCGIVICGMTYEERHMKELRLPADTKHIEEAMDFVVASVKEKSSKNER